MHLNYYTAVGTKLLKQQGRAKAAKAAATQQLGRGRGEGLSPFLQLVVTELLRLRGREQRIPVPLAFLEGSSEQEGRKQKGSEGSSSAAGVNQTQGTVLMTTWDKSIHVKQSKEKLGGMEERCLL